MRGWERGCVSIFQSTLPQEERPAVPVFVSSILLFQSTLPQEERRLEETQQAQARNFNPRSHKRSDVAVITQYRSRTISIHAPTRGATVQQN